MEQQSSQPGYAPGGAPGSRPGQVTAAAVILFVIGGLAVLFGLLALSAAGLFGDLAALYTILSIVGIVIGGVQIFAGVRVLGLQDSGRSLGVIVSAVAIVVAIVIIIVTLITIDVFPFGQIVGIAINGLVIFFLQQNKGAFTR